MSNNLNKLNQEIINNRRQFDELLDKLLIIKNNQDLSNVNYIKRLLQKNEQEYRQLLDKQKSLESSILRYSSLGNRSLCKAFILLAEKETKQKHKCGLAIINTKELDNQISEKKALILCPDNIYQNKYFYDCSLDNVKKTSKILVLNDVSKNKPIGISTVIYKQATDGTFISAFDNENYSYLNDFIDYYINCDFPYINSNIITLTKKYITMKNNKK